jgi:hypothetical protein
MGGIFSCVVLGTSYLWRSLQIFSIAITVSVLHATECAKNDQPVSIGGTIALFAVAVLKLRFEITD